MKVTNIRTLKDLKWVLSQLNETELSSKIVDADSLKITIDPWKITVKFELPRDEQ